MKLDGSYLCGCEGARNQAGSPEISLQKDELSSYIMKASNYK